MSESNRNIPKIIHHIWKSKDVPDEWKECVNSWKEHHPDWQYKLWTDNDSRAFVKEEYPDFLEIFDSYSYDIQRADATRYLILHEYGGLYVDLDFECLCSINDILSNRTFVIGYEPKKHATWHGEDSLICNAFMASIPGHPFLLEIIRAMKSINPRITLHSEVLKTTGPIMMNRVLKRYMRKDISILDEHVLYPFTSDSKELDILINKKARYLSLKQQCARHGTYAIHYWANMWVRNLAGELVNPDPFSVEGHTFYPGLDSIGHDIGNVGRDIHILASECSRNAEALGFNTDGFLKYYIRPKSEWVRIDNKNRNEGLYIKKCSLTHQRRR